MKYEIILTSAFKKELNNIKKYDTEDDWTYWINDEDLKGDVRWFIERNSFFNKKFKEYKIDSFDTSLDRTKTLDKIMKSLKKKNIKFNTKMHKKNTLSDTQCIFKFNE